MLTNRFRRFADEVFKQFIKKAEEIDIKAPISSKEELSQNEAINLFFLKNRITERLFKSKSHRQVQIVLEESFLALNDMWHNEQKKSISANALAERYLFMWSERPELKVLNFPVSDVYRSMFYQPLTKTTNNYSKQHKRVTKEGEAQVSPFFFTALDDNIYLSMIKGVGSKPDGIMSLRRVIDHMAAFDHKPSSVVSLAIIEEADIGKWPRVLMSFLDYHPHITLDVWARAITSMRRFNGYFDTAVKIFSKALDSGIQPSWILAEPLVKKYLNHSKIEEAEAIFDKLKSKMMKYEWDSDSTENILKRDEVLNEVCLTFINLLIDCGHSKPAQMLFRSLIGDRFNKTEVFYNTGFKILEAKEDYEGAIEYYRTLQNEKLPITKTTIGNVLKAAQRVGEESIPFADEIKELMLEKEDLKSPFASNMLMMIYGGRSEWDRLGKYLADISNFPINRLTRTILDRQIERCQDKATRRLLLSYAADLSKASENRPRRTEENQ